MKEVIHITGMKEVIHITGMREVVYITGMAEIMARLSISINNVASILLLLLYSKKEKPTQNFHENTDIHP